MFIVPTLTLKKYMILYSFLNWCVFELQTSREMSPYIEFHCKNLFSFMVDRLDGWLSAAADCLELFPDQLIVVAGEQLSQQGGTFSEDDQAEHVASQKKLLFDTIAKYYSGQEKYPLLSGRYLDIHAAILKLLSETLHWFIGLCDCELWFFFLCPSRPLRWIRRRDNWYFTSPVLTVSLQMRGRCSMPSKHLSCVFGC